MAEGGESNIQRECMEKIINKIAIDISDDWMKLARELKVKNTDINNIDNEWRSLYEKAYQMLQKWYSKEGYYCGMEKLIEALRNIGKNDKADEIEHMHPGTSAPTHEGFLQAMIKAHTAIYDACIGCIDINIRTNQLVAIRKIADELENMNTILMLLVNPSHGNFASLYNTCCILEKQIEQLIKLVISKLTGTKKPRGTSDILTRTNGESPESKVSSCGHHSTFPGVRKRVALLSFNERAMEYVNRTLTDIYDCIIKIMKDNNHGLFSFLFDVTTQLKKMNIVLMITGSPQRQTDDKIHEQCLRREQNIKELLDWIVNRMHES